MTNTSSSVIDVVRTVLREEENVELAYVFGSAARGDAAAGSDVDVAVRCRSELDLLSRGRLAERLEQATGGRAVDLVDLRAAPALLQAEVVRDGVAVVVRDPALRFDYEQRVFHLYHDTRRLRAMQQELLAERANDGRAG